MCRITLLKFCLGIAVFLGSIAHAADPFEPNGTVFQATLIDSSGVVRGGSLDELTDQDFFQIIPRDTGSLKINLRTFNESGVDLAVFDNNGDFIAAAPSSDGSVPATMLNLTVVAGNVYFIRIRDNEFGIVTPYQIALSNQRFAKPRQPIVNATVPKGQVCHGVSTVIIEADLAEAADMGFIILTADQAMSNTPGVAVELLVDGNFSGFANPRPGSSTHFDANIDDPALTAVGVHTLNAAVRVIDGSVPAFVQRGRFSAPLRLNCK